MGGHAIDFEHVVDLGPVGQRPAEECVHEGFTRSDLPQVHDLVVQCQAATDAHGGIGDELDFSGG